MQGRFSEDQDVVTRETVDLWRRLSDSPDSRPQKGQYSVCMPYMVRMSSRGSDGRDSDGRMIPNHVLEFPGDGVACVKTGLYTCKLWVELTNSSWRISPWNCSFIEGKGSCAVTVYLHDFIYVGPIPSGNNFMLDMGMLVSMKDWMCSKLGYKSSEQRGKVTRATISC